MTDMEIPDHLIISRLKGQTFIKQKRTRGRQTFSNVLKEQKILESKKLFLKILKNQGLTFYFLIAPLNIKIIKMQCKTTL